MNANINSKSHAGEEQNIDLNDEKKSPHLQIVTSFKRSQWGDSFYG